MKINSRVKWLIHIIPYNYNAEPHLALDELGRKNLGFHKHEFVFVADYKELVNYTVKEDIYKTGGEIQGKNRVSAIIFPLKESSLYPANARGLLQVVRAIDHKYRGTKDYVSFDFEHELSGEQIRGLEEKHIILMLWLITVKTTQSLVV